MSLRRRGGIWWIDVSAPNGERIRRTTGTANKALAQEFHDRIKVELWRIDKLGAKPKRCWNDAVVRWLKENRHKATANEDVSKLRWLDRHLRGKDLAAINRNVIDLVTKEKLADGWTNATVNRTLELLRAMLRNCVNEWEWLDRAPYVRMLKEPTRRIRFLTQEEARSFSPNYRRIWQTWRHFHSQRVCGRRMSPVLSGRRSMRNANCVGCIRIRPKRAERSPSL